MSQGRERRHWSVRCLGCDSVLKVPADTQRQRAKCPHCGGPVSLIGPPPPPVAVAARWPLFFAVGTGGFLAVCAVAVMIVVVQRKATPPTAHEEQPDRAQVAEEARLAEAVPRPIEVPKAATPGSILATLGDARLKHWGSITGVCFSPDGRTIASCGIDEQACLWDAGTGQLVRSLRGHTGALGSLAYSPDGARIVTCAWGDDGNAKIWESDTGRELLTYRGHHGNKSVNGVAYSPDGRWVASAGSDRTVQVWNAATGQRAYALTEDESIERVAFSPDGRFLAYKKDSSVVLCNSRNGNRVLTLPHPARVRSLAFSPDGRLVTGGLDGRVSIWDAATGREIFRIDHGAGRNADGQLAWTAVDEVACSPNGRLIASWNCNNVRVWDFATGQERHRIDQKGCKKIAFSPSGDRLATSIGLSVMVWDTTTWDRSLGADGHLDEIISLACGAGGKLAATGSFDKTVRIWDLVSRRERFTLTGHAIFPESLAFSPAGETLASGGSDATGRVGEILLWDTATGKMRGVLNGHSQSRIATLDFSPDGKRLVSSSGKEVIIWDVGSRRKIREFGSDTTSLAISPDGSTLAVVGFRDGVSWIQMLDTATGEPRGVMPSTTDGFNGMEFSYDGSRLVSKDYGGVLRTWDVAGRREASPFTGGQVHHVNSMFAVRDRDLVFAICGNAKEHPVEMRLWDISTGALKAVAPMSRQQLSPHNWSFIRSSFTSDGQFAVVANRNATLSIYASIPQP